MMQNLKQGWNRMMSFSSSLPFSSGIKYNGLYNQGATCYLNSVLQVLFMTKDFREALERYCKLHSSDTMCLDVELFMLFKELEKQATRPDFITDLLGITNVFVQGDAAEWFEKIMGRLSRSEASQIFQGKLKHRNKCLTCEKETSSDAPFWHLPLDLVEKRYTISVVDSIQEFFRESHFTGPDQIFCQHCQHKSDSAVKCEMVHPPQVLTLLLKRFQFNNDYRLFVKNHQSVVVPRKLTVEEKHDYELYAFVEHSGSLRSGHYTVKIKSQDDEKWYSFNDTHVTLMYSQPFQEVNSERSDRVYLLFYRKIHIATVTFFSCSIGVKLVALFWVVAMVARGIFALLLMAFYCACTPGNTEPSPSSAFTEKTETIEKGVKTEEDEDDKVVGDESSRVIEEKHEVESHYASVDGRETQDKTGQSLIKDDLNKAERKEYYAETGVNDTGEKYSTTERKWDNIEMKDTGGGEESSNKVEKQSDKKISDGGDEGRHNLNEQSDEGKDLHQNRVISDWKAAGVKGYDGDQGLNAQEGETSNSIPQKDEEIKLRPGKRNDGVNSLETAFPETKKKKKASGEETDDVSTTRNHRMVSSSSSLKGSSPAIKYYGLYNQGATSDLNSVLQVLFMTKDFREELERSRSSREGPCLDLGLSLFFDDLQKATTKTDSITHLLGIKNVSVQSDAAECFEKIMGSLSSSEACQIFQGKLKHINKCFTCEKETSSDAPFWHLPLELDEYTISVADGIKEFFRESRLTESNQIFCQHCQQKSDAAVKCEMVHPPQVLTLMLKRFKFDYHCRPVGKNHQCVKVLSRLTVEEKHDYELYAFVEHIGYLRSGHYTVKIKSQDDEKWYSFNDDHVTLMDDQPFQVVNSESSDRVYLLFYRKIHTENTEVSPSSAFNEETGTITNAVKTKEHEEEQVSLDDVSDRQQTQDETGNVEKKGIDYKGEERQNLTMDDESKADTKENMESTHGNDTGDKYNNVIEAERQGENNLDQQSDRIQPLRENQISDGGDQGRRNNMDEQSDEEKALVHKMVLHLVFNAAAEKQRLRENPKVLEKNRLWEAQTPSTRSEENSKSPQDESADKRNYKGDQRLNVEEGKTLDSQSVEGNNEGPKDPGDDLNQKPRDEGDGFGRQVAGEGRTELTETKRSDTEKTQGPVRYRSDLKISPETLAKINKSNVIVKVVETETNEDNLSQRVMRLNINDPPSSRAGGFASISGLTQTNPTRNEIHHTPSNQTHLTHTQTPSYFHTTNLMSPIYPTHTQTPSLYYTQYETSHTYPTHTQTHSPHFPPNLNPGIIPTHTQTPSYFHSPSSMSQTHSTYMSYNGWTRRDEAQQMFQSRSTFHGPVMQSTGPLRHQPIKTSTQRMRMEPYTTNSGKHTGFSWNPCSRK